MEARLGGADGGQVAVALIGEDQGVGLGALDAGGDSGSAAVGGLKHIAIKIVIGEDGAADRGHTDDVAGLELAFLDQLVYALGHQTVDDAVVAARAVVELLVGQQLSFFKDYRHLT